MGTHKPPETTMSRFFVALKTIVTVAGVITTILTLMFFCIGAGVLVGTIWEPLGVLVGVLLLCIWGAALWVFCTWLEETDWV